MVDSSDPRDSATLGTAWESLKSAIRELNRADLSVRTIERKFESRRKDALSKGRKRPETLSRTTIGHVLNAERTGKGKRLLPPLRNVLLVVEILADSDVVESLKDKIAGLWEAADAEIRQQRPSSAPAPGAAKLDVLVPTRWWVTEYLDQPRPQTNDAPELGPAERLLRDDPEAGDPLHGLSTLGTLFGEKRLSVGVVTIHRSLQVEIKSTAELWANLLADSVLHRNLEGDRRWLVRETDKILAAAVPAHIERVSAVWTWIFDHCLRPTGPAFDPDLLKLFLADARHYIRGRGHRLDRVFTFLINLMRAEPSCVEQITAALQRYVKSPDFGLRLHALRLIGLAQAVTDKCAPSAEPLATLLDTVDVKVADKVAVKAGSYSIKAMTYPLTRRDVARIIGQPLPADAETRYRYPHIFDVADGTGSDFDLLGDQVRDIIAKCWSADRDEQWRWDVPTAAEWMELAGCGAAPAAPFPWGDSPPEPWLANLSFDAESAPAQVLPVGSRWEGRNPQHETQDCCGNVHELVRVGDGDRYPHDFRLAGGSYRTHAANASCRRLRYFTDRTGPARRNIGLRLIGFKASDEALRWSKLEEFLRTQSGGRRRSRRTPAKETPQG